MPVKILQNGNNHPVIFKCKNCGCVFEAGLREYVIYKGLFRVKISGICPYCGELVTMHIKRKQFEQCK